MSFGVNGVWSLRDCYGVLSGYVMPTALWLYIDIPGLTVCGPYGTATEFCLAMSCLRHSGYILIFLG